MAEHRGRQGVWPPKTDNQPIADFKHPDGFLRSERSVAGPLRLGTEPRVGPNGLVSGANVSDFGMDRVTPRGFDPLGTELNRIGPQESSPLLSTSVRARKPDGR
jgi:hypothetical protein